MWGKPKAEPWLTPNGCTHRHSNGAAFGLLRACGWAVGHDHEADDAEIQTADAEPVKADDSRWLA